MARGRNMARMNVASAPGTGTITLGTAVDSYLSFASAGVQDGEIVSYVAVDGAAREVGRATYNSSGTTLSSRTVLRSTNSNSAVSLGTGAIISIGPVAEDLLIETNAQTGTTYTIVGNDLGKLVTLSNASAIAVTLPQATSGGLFSTGWFCRVRNIGVGTVTITPTTSTINAASTLVLPQNASAVIVSNGTNYTAEVSGPVLNVASVCEGRLTLATGNPIGGGSAATTLYYTPYVGNRIALYDGASAWNVRTFSELSISLSGLTSNTNYDVFIYDNAGTPAIDTLTAWTDATNRATALVYQNGVYVKSGATTRRYVGTIRTTGTTGQTEDSVTKRFVWNYYNRIQKNMVKNGSGSHTYTTQSYRQMNADATNQLEFVRGAAEDAMFTHCTASYQSDTANQYAFTTIGLDGLTPLTSRQAASMYTAVANIGSTGFTFAQTNPSAGYHYFVWMQLAQSGGTATWFNDNHGIAAGFLA